MKLIEAVADKDFQEAGLLFLEYSKGLGIDLCFQHFEEELKSLPMMYGRPEGILFLIRINDDAVACTGVRNIGANVAELKRMYVREAYRKTGMAQSLLNASLAFAKEAGYEKIRLDTLNTMLPAIALYEKNGFRKIPAYYFNPEPTAVYFEKVL
jgi:putative acetyltransferase